MSSSGSQSSTSKRKSNLAVLPAIPAGLAQELVATGDSGMNMQTGTGLSSEHTTVELTPVSMTTGSSDIMKSQELRTGDAVATGARVAQEEQKMA